MDQKVLDAGIGEVPSHPVDPNIPSLNGGHHNHHHVISDNIARSYPLVGESTSSNTGMATLSSQQQQTPSGTGPAPTHLASHVVRDMRSR